MKATPFWPAEWSPQDGVLVAWPHAGTDWRDNLAAVEAAYGGLLAALSRHADVRVCVPDPAHADRMRAIAVDAGADAARLRAVVVDYDDTWLRDTGPVTVFDQEQPRLLDFRFTGWGGKFEAARDDRLVAALIANGLFHGDARHVPVGFALEGGAIETDGVGTLLSTWHCLAARHPGRPQADIEAVLATHLGIQRFLWLQHGAIDGDDTDAHIDTLARFASTRDIVYQACDDPGDAHHAELARMAAELQAFVDADGRPYRLHALPWPRAIHDGDGRRLAASYANFLITNGAVLMPGYGDVADAAAAEVLAAAFPDRAIEVVPCRPLIEQNGSLHCLTMQLPRGVLADV